MAEATSRSLRDGSLEGEHCPALTIKDSRQSPLGSHAFNHFLSSLASNISASKSQARGLVLVALSKSPAFYFNLLRSKGIDADLVRVLDCYSDPFGWKDRILKLGSDQRDSVKGPVTEFKDVKDTSKLLSSILDVGRGFVGDGKARFAVAIDSVSVILRHSPLSAVASLISTLRSHDRVSCMFWLIHSDLHEPRASSALEYISTMVASLEATVEVTEGIKNPENLFGLEQNSHRGKFQARLKRRNGRVKLLHEDFHMEQGGIKFTAVSSENTAVNQSLVPKVQFNLQLSEKEKDDRAKVVLPFEHQDI
ncbi:elongator complex protein 5 isoform X2 [Asparagus officinalis]|uniref:elongator complex protein 5 isoform X2 n=1 Tax=Asparagus officinalis TaxID=4686 RepID=UPI00098E8219|nr:elongator complex protein 5 isoform X2 [Asparagus officinalis]